ncbi:MAG: hypothetical protein HY986_10765 [Candidatus Melainabacteria bacterium]|nr:hypothetical protein [Candidatus Melainabacteria bacterium]
MAKKKKRDAPPSVTVSVQPGPYTDTIIMTFAHRPSCPCKKCVDARLKAIKSKAKAKRRRKSRDR